MPDSLFTLRKHNHYITFIGYINTTSFGVILCSGDAGGNIILWDLDVKRPYYMFKSIQHICCIQCILYDNINDILIVQTRSPYHSYIIGYKFTQLKGNNIPKELFRFGTKSTTFCRMNMVYNDKDKETLIMCTGIDREIFEIWSVNQNKKILSYNLENIFTGKYERGMIMSLYGKYINDDLLIYIATESGYMDVYSVGLKKFILSHRFDMKNDEDNEYGTLTCMTLNNKYNRGIIGTSNNIIYGFTINLNDKIISIKKRLKIKNHGVSMIKIRNYDNKLFGCAGWDKRTRIFSFKSFKLLTVLKGHKECVTDIAFNPLNNICVTSSKDNNINLYKIY